LITHKATAQIPGAGEASAFLDWNSGDIILTIGTDIGVVGFLFHSGYNDVSIRQQPESFAMRDANVLAWFNANGLKPGIYNLGNLLPTGLRSRQEVNARVLFSFTPFGSPPVQSEVCGFYCIPEPASLTLSTIGLAIAAGRRRQFTQQ
jgi:hypothetical protein